MAYWKLNKEQIQELEKVANRINVDCNGIFYDNEHYKEYWGDFLKKDAPYFSNLVGINQYKIYQMKLYIGDFSPIADAKKQVKQMNKVLDLGWEILEDKYYDKVNNWKDANSISYTLIYIKSNGDINREPDGKLKGNFFDDMMCQMDNKMSSIDKWLINRGLTRDDVQLLYTSEWTNGLTDDENSIIYKKYLDECNKARQTAINKYFKLIAKYSEGWGD